MTKIIKKVKIIDKLIKQKTTNSFTQYERLKLIILSDKFEIVDDVVKIVFFLPKNDLIIKVICTEDKFYDETILHIPNQIIEKIEIDDIV